MISTELYYNFIDAEINKNMLWRASPLHEAKTETGKSEVGMSKHSYMVFQVLKAPKKNISAHSYTHACMHL